MAHIQGKQVATMPCNNTAAISTLAAPKKQPIYGLCVELNCIILVHMHVGKTKYLQQACPFNAMYPH